MAIGDRIRFFRKLRGLTMKYLGMSVGFPESNADVRIAQYENDSRAPKAESHLLILVFIVNNLR